ncbi:MAG TPA: NUDIX domain-containing protein [Syntrophorhabdaceae bacterium]|nr:NUDIX domain-containing protein [Syntrophorhabdaceae bacterium]
MQKFSETHPARVFSHCPRCGSIEFKFNDKNKFACGACNLKLYTNAATAVAVILETPDGRIVLTKRKFDPQSGFYDLPGGFVDTMERVEDAVSREILEEVGISVAEMKFLASFPNEYIFEGISYFTCDLAFVCPVNDVSNLRPADDVADVLIIHPKEIDPDTISFPSIKKILRVYIQTYSGS